MRKFFLRKTHFSQETNDDNLDLCNFSWNMILLLLVKHIQLHVLIFLKTKVFPIRKLTQSDDELLLNVSKIESKSHQPSTSRFHEPKRQIKEIEDMQSKKFADSTMSKIKWATTLFKQWKSTRNIRANDPNVGLSPIRLYMDTFEYNHKFLSDSSFIQIKNSLDNVMKLRAEVRVPKKQAEEISLEEEEKLWASGSLGSDNARHLLNTKIKKQIKEVSSIKTLKKKSVVAYQNTENQARCVVNLFELYASHCPPFPRKADALYLRPLKIPNGNIWYADQPIGRHSLANIVASICQEAGIGCYRTNLSLRASAATRMYDAGVDEQLICEVTNRRSNAVRNYKRTNEKQKRKINSVIQG
ncbi:unnamed protein product [Mytilus coruscus]|uniref:ZMYM2-like/QRICH1 C-terminal domain-containing protein n=1 Tax=Mytilus coruscus TaxID=42192 RepID=A0A6J8C405_MYTCO|nr:unnamed protein product [Mytilus coruscus]